MNIRPARTMLFKFAEALAFRAAAIFSGYGFGCTDDSLYLLIFAVYMIRNTWFTAIDWEAVEEVDDKLDEVTEVIPEMKILGKPQTPLQRMACSFGFFLSNVIPLSTPPTYTLLGFGMSKDSTFVLSTITLSLLLTARITTFALIYQRANQIRK